LITIEYSTDEGVNPDIVLVGIGVELTQEVIACAGELRKDFPDLRVRVINVVDLLIFAPVSSVLIHSDYTLHVDKGE
jgi:xylulose-5-phosphate/fructose-6-phosphate phosphoketolase